jgi:hypothetical protein
MNSIRGRNVALAYNVTGLNEGAIKSTSLSQTTNDYRMRNSINNHNTALSFKPMLPERVGIVRGVVGFNKNCEAGAFLFTL